MLALASVAILGFVCGVVTSLIILLAPRLRAWARHNDNPAYVCLCGHPFTDHVVHTLWKDECVWCECMLYHQAEIT